MSYVALYRKYRPATFDTILGQENVTKILKNQVKSGKISHAYLFSGSRGTGKTSASKVFARAINCLNPKEGEPCNECAICKSILEGNTTDVIEMDAASNNSVENIRQIRQEVVYATIDVKYRVYIIDEAHMLTTSAFNALLKTLEEPPENVVFILATTEQHKIPVTILSRCLRFEFNRISEEVIYERLTHILDAEGVKAEEEALKYIAKIADGGMRDAISVLDRCMSESQEMLKYEDVLRIIGAIDDRFIASVADNILDRNAMKVIEMIDEIIIRGKDLRQFNYQITEKFLDKLIGEKENTARYITIIDRLSKLDNDLRLTSKPVIVLKSAMIELCNVTGNSDTNSQQGAQDTTNIEPLITKIAYLESEVEKLKNRKSISQSNVNSSNINIVKEEKKEQDVDDATVFQDIENLKKEVIGQGKLKLYSSLAGAKAYENANFLILITNNSFAYSILILQENIDDLTRIYEEKYGVHKDVIIRLQEEQKQSDTKIEKVLKQKDVSYTSFD
ncbi:MAG: DNA polymerase III subunit gamma/tau [Clostridia bacterium]|nr:DNA polymerase III subunit gamma/tau [Clostridia bacterium]